MSGVLPVNPFENMNAEIEDVFQGLSGEDDSDLPELIEIKHNQLLQNIAGQVDQSMQLQGKIKGVIQGLTDESTQINLTAEAKLHLKKLQGTLTQLNQEQDALTSQLKTSSTSLKVLQERTQDLRRSAGKLRATVRKAPPKYSSLPPNILTGGMLLSMTFA